MKGGENVFGECTSILLDNVIVFEMVKEEEEEEGKRIHTC